MSVDVRRDIEARCQRALVTLATHLARPSLGCARDWLHVPLQPMVANEHTNSPSSTSSGSSPPVRARVAADEPELAELLQAGRGNSAHARRSAREVRSSIVAIDAVCAQQDRDTNTAFERTNVLGQWTALVRTLLAAPVALSVVRTGATSTTLFLFDERSAPSLGVRDCVLRHDAHAALACLSAFALFCCDVRATSAHRLVFSSAANAYVDAALDRVQLLRRLLARVLAHVNVAGHARARLVLETALVCALPLAEARGDGARVHALVAYVRTHTRDDVQAFRRATAAECAMQLPAMDDDDDDAAATYEAKAWTRVRSPLDREPGRVSLLPPTEQVRV